MTSTRQLIGRLASEARAVRPVASPGYRAARWSGLCALVIAIAVVLMGARPGLLEAMSIPANAMEWMAAVLTGVLASYAMFQVSIPGRPVRWGWLPVPALAAWAASIGWGCVGEWRRLGMAAFAYDAHGAECLAVILALSVPLLAMSLYLVRHAGPVRPVATAVLAGLSGAGFASAGVSLAHDGENALMVLLWHGGAVAVLVGAMALFGGRWFAWISGRTAAGSNAWKRT